MHVCMMRQILSATNERTNEQGDSRSLIMNLDVDFIAGGSLFGLHGSVRRARCYFDLRVDDLSLYFELQTRWDRCGKLSEGPPPRVHIGTAGV